MSEHDEIAELLGAYALDAVEPDERDRVELHLAECPRCRAEVAEHREVAAVLAQSGAPAPEGVWARIAADLAPSPPPMRVAVLPADDDAEVVDLAGARRNRPNRVVLAVVGLAAAIVLVVGLAAVIGNDDGKGQTTEELAAEAVGNSKLQVDLAGEGVSAKAVVQADGRGYLILDDVPPPADGDVYQLWGKVHGEVLSLGTFGGTSVVPFSVDAGHIGDIELFAVTEEHSPGVVASTQDPMMAGTV